MKKITVIVLAMTLIGLQACAPSVPKDVLKPDGSVLAKRSVQTRRFATQDEKKILSASAAALQDMGFSLENSETKLGLIVAAKDADATNKGQVALATAGLICGVLAGNVDTRLYKDLDDVQKVRASLVTHINPENKSTFVRITFQRVVWSKDKRINRMETLDDPRLYQGFYDRLSKSVFLEDHQI